MFDKKGYRLTMLVDMVAFIIAALILIMALTTGNFGLIILGFLVGGFAYGGVTPMQSAVISDFFGRTYYSVNFSVIVTNLMIGSFASTIAGKLYDMSQSYMSTIYMMIIVTVVAFVVYLGIRRPGSNK
jgi:OFA family oxalate/formate antiporter-like MFS transporter